MQRRGAEFPAGRPGRPVGVGVQPILGCAAGGVGLHPCGADRGDAGLLADRVRGAQQQR
jgi:hypothetical protein